MDDIANMFENLTVAIVASDANFKVIYANDKCKKMFKDMLNSENFVGDDLDDCHKPETMEKIKELYQEFRDKKKSLGYYTEDGSEGRLTIVNAPFYDGDEFAGVVEFIFEGSLA